MRKSLYLFATIVLLLLTACENKGYKITGTVEGAADGDTVYLQERAQREFIKLDSAVITDGKFTFKGTQDSTVVRYITYVKEDERLFIDFFLEKGNIAIQLTKSNDSATGTVNNDLYQGFRSGLNTITQKQNSLYESLTDTTLTEEQKNAKIAELENTEAETKTLVGEQIKKNNSNLVGLFLLKNYYYLLGYAELDPILTGLSEESQTDETVVRLKGLVAKAKATAEGQKFTDFAMKTPDGKEIKLSDYAGKGKIVLVDFWASWCGPCRQEMPELVETYAKYKNKGFEIVGVSFDKDGEAWKAGIKQLNMTWPQMSDLKYWDSEAAKLYAVNSIPHTLLLDGTGNIIARGLRGEKLQKKLAELIK